MSFEGAVKYCPEGMGWFCKKFHFPHPWWCIESLKWIVNSTSTLIYEFNKITDTCLFVWVVIPPFIGKNFCVTSCILTPTLFFVPSRVFLLIVPYGNTSLLYS